MIEKIACLIFLVGLFPVLGVVLMKMIIGIIAGVLCVVGAIPYIKAIIQNPNVRPAKASWIIWFSVDAITFLGMYSAGTLNWQMIGIMCSVTMILTLALIKGEKGWTKLEKFCISGAGVGIFLWLMPINPVISILVAAGVNLIGSIPTVTNVWKDPRRENKLGWMIGLASCICAIIAIPQYTLGDAVQPIGFCLNNINVVAIIFLRPLWLRA